MKYNIKKQQIIQNEKEGWSFQFWEEVDFVRIVYFEQLLSKTTEFRIPKDCVEYFIDALENLNDT
jgi:hypothetical protein